MHHSTTPVVQYVNDFLDYLEIEKGLSSKTQENYSRYLKRFTDWLAGVAPTLLPHELTPEHIWNYRVYLSRKTLSKQSNEPLQKSTQNFYLIALRALLNYFADRNIASLPSEKIKLAKQTKEKTVHFLNLEQIEKLILAPDIKSNIGLRDRAILETLFSAGFRVSELVALNRDQLKINENSKFFELMIIGKGNKPRTVYFSQRCLHWLNNYLKSRKDIDPSLFINYKPGIEKTNKSRRLTSRSVENVVKKYTKMAGLPVMTSPHTLRHSYATDLLTQGVDLRLVQEFLWHRNIITTQIYTHVTNKKLRDVYLKFHGGKDLKN